MTTSTVTNDTDTAPQYTRQELEETMDLWMKANEKAEATGDWSYLGELYAPEAEYRWTLGPGEEFVARGKQQIVDWAVGEQMAGLEGWTYPYEEIIIDEKKGMIVGFWRQVSPFTRKDGSQIAVPGVGCSWFKYGGNHKWIWQRDVFDLMSVFSVFSEIAAQGNLSEPLKEKLHTVGMGKLMNGHERTSPKPAKLDRFRQGAAMAKVFMLGK